MRYFTFLFLGAEFSNSDVYFTLKARLNSDPIFIGNILSVLGFHKIYSWKSRFAYLPCFPESRTLLDNRL